MKVISPPRKVQANTNWKKKSKKAKKMPWFLILFFGYIIAFTYCFFFAGFFEVKGVEIYVDDLNIESILKKETEDFLNTEFLPFINKSDNAFVLLISGSLTNLENSLKNDLPRLADINARFNLFGNGILNLSGSTRKPYGIYCDNTNFCYYFDRDRLAFEPAPEVKGALWEIKDELGQVEIGKPVIEDLDLYNKILEAHELLNNFDNPKVDHFLIPKGTVGEFWIKTVAGWSIYLDQTVDIKTQILGMNAVLEKVDKNKKIEYFDLRVQNRIYYK